MRFLPLRLMLAAALALVSALALQPGDFYQPLPPLSSGVVGTTAAYRRSPCPALNTLANHGFIARDGKNITAAAVKEAVMKYFNIDSVYADTLAALAKKPVFNLDELSLHNNVEHDMSLVHKDAFFGQDPAATDPQLVADFFGHVGASNVMDPWFFARIQQRLLRDCMKNNPQCEFSNTFLLSVTLGRQGLLMRAMGGKNEEAVNMETVRSFLVQETFPIDWQRPSEPIKQEDIQMTRGRLSPLLQSSGEWLGDGIGRTSHQLHSDSASTKCLEVADQVLRLSSCSSSSNTQRFRLDDAQRLIADGDGGLDSCLAVENGSTATSKRVVEMACSDQVSDTMRWRYDASGRLRPVHTPDLCLDLVEKSTAVSVVTADCSTRSQQRFYSFYINFQPSVSHIASIFAPQYCLGVDANAAGDVRPVLALACASFNQAQQLTLDEQKRLVLQYDTSQCLDIDNTSPVSTVVQKPCAKDSTTWLYDSLSRLHPGSDISYCVMFPKTSGGKVELAKCGDTLKQKWFVSETKNPDIRPSDQYYRPNVFESSGKPGTTATFSRSPCPALNTLANHGLLPRSGRNLTAEQVKAAVVEHFNIDPSYAEVLIVLAKKTVFNLDDLSVHNAAEHDMSLVHADAFFGQDPAVSDSTLTADLLNHVGSSGQMDALFFARTQARRRNDCQMRNPQCDLSNDFLMSVALGRLGLLMRGMGGGNENRIDIAALRSFLVDEKFPDGFKKSPTPITQVNIHETRGDVLSLIKSSEDWLANGFAGRDGGAMITSDTRERMTCLEISKGSTEAGAVLVTAACDSKKKEQQFSVDDHRRLVVSKSQLCLAALDFGALTGTKIVQLDCNEDASNQRWTYDASGRLRPAHAPGLCADVGADDSVGELVVLVTCSASPQQRFYSIYDAFQPLVSHVNSVDNRQLCVSVADGVSDDGSVVQVALCDPLLVEQQITMDNRQRLVFKHSEKCLGQSGSDAPLVQVTCRDDTTQRWIYDSLGRLHSIADPSACVSIKATATAITEADLHLTECTDSTLQRWFASDAKDPNNRPQNAYYRPNRDESSGDFGTKAIYSRSLCPALNALANHGLISRDGRNISRIDLLGAAMSTFNLERALVEKLLEGITDEWISLDQFSDPTRFDYFGSVLHSDAFFDPDPAAIDPDLASTLFSRVGSDNSIDLVYLASAHKRQLDIQATSSGASPSAVEMNAVKAMKPGLLLRVMSGNSDLSMSADLAKRFLIEERIADEFVKPPAVVALLDVTDSANTVASLMESGNAWLGDPFRPRLQQVFAIVDGAVLCMSLDRREVTLEACDVTRRSQLFTYDGQQRLVVDATTSCLDVIDGKLGDGAVIGHVDCTDWSHQKWVLDVTGRLHPQHGPKYCLEIARGAPGVLKRCSDSAAQVFFTVLTSMGLVNRQLVSAASDRAVPASQLTRCLVASSVMTTELCSPSKEAQVFSLDGERRLVAKDNQCISTSVDLAPSGGSPISLATCSIESSSSTIRWAYDALGRLHPVDSFQLCLTVGASSREPTTLEACAKGPAQQWIVATLSAREPGSTGRGFDSHTSRSVPGIVCIVLLVISLVWV